MKGDQGEIVDLVKVKGKHAGEGKEAKVAHNVCMVTSFHCTLRVGWALWLSDKLPWYERHAE